MANDTASPTVPVGTLAKLFNLTDVRVQQLTKLGVVVKSGHGRYDLWQSVKGYIKYLQDRAGVKSATSGGEQDETGELGHHRSRLYKAKADQAELEFAMAVGRVHEAKAIELVWSDMILNSRSRLIAMPPKYTPMLLNKSDPNEVKDILEKAVNESLNELTNYDPTRVAHSAFSQNKPAVETASEIDGEPMG
jgi:phage terminase Nu1 subunit (DNA packaging protein)